MDIEKCQKCEECNVIMKDHFGIYLGCYKEPYKGKWIAEIKNCPVEVEEQKK